MWRRIRAQGGGHSTASERQGKKTAAAAHPQRPLHRHKSEQESPALGERQPRPASVRNGQGSLTVRVRGPLGFGFGHSLTRPRLHQESKCSPRGPPDPALRRVPVRNPSPAQPPPVPESTRLPAGSVGSGAPALSKGNFAHRGSPTGARPRHSALR